MNLFKRCSFCITSCQVHLAVYQVVYFVYHEYSNGNIKVMYCGICELTTSHQLQDSFHWPQYNSGSRLYCIITSRGIKIVISILATDLCQVYLQHNLNFTWITQHDKIACIMATQVFLIRYIWWHRVILVTYHWGSRWIFNSLYSHYFGSTGGMGQWNTMCSIGKNLHVYQANLRHVCSNCFFFLGSLLEVLHLKLVSLKIQI